MSHFGDLQGVSADATSQGVIGRGDAFISLSPRHICEDLGDCFYEQLISAKLKLHSDAEQFHGLRTTQLAYRDALNSVSRYAFEYG